MGEKQQKKHAHPWPRRSLESMLRDVDAARPGHIPADWKGKSELQHEREVKYVCPWGRCVNFYDPVEHRITWGFGSVGCPCDQLPGWNARHPEMLPKPAWVGKAIGRNGPRVHRSRRRHSPVGASGYMKWVEELDHPERFM